MTPPPLSILHAVYLPMASVHVSTVTVLLWHTASVLNYLFLCLFVSLNALAVVILLTPNPSLPISNLHFS